MNLVGFSREEEGKRKLPLGFTRLEVGNIRTVTRRTKSSIGKKVKCGENSVFWAFLILTFSLNTLSCSAEYAGRQALLTVDEAFQVDQRPAR